MGAIFFFAFILFVMGGVTAYMGDRLGSYIGKKRHSTFGLRPRHTAMLWTVVSGGVIAVGTLALFVALNSTFKTALIRGSQLLSDNSELASRNRALVTRNADAARLAEADMLAARTAQTKAETAQKTLAAVTGQLGQTKATLMQSRAILAQSQAALTQSQAALAGRQAALAAAERHLADTERGLGSARGDLKLAQASVRQARAGVQSAKRQALAATQQVVQANKTVLALGIEQDRLARLNRSQETQLQASQGKALIFRRGEELGRTVISARQAPAALRRELSVFLDQAELTARQRGAGGAEGTPAILVPATREAALDALSENIAAEGGFLPSIVVVATARFNTFRGEPVKLELHPYGNILIFPKNAVVAQGTVDGSLSDEAVLKRLQVFLTGDVRASALKRGIIPVPDPQTGAPLVGQPIGSPVWGDLVRRIQSAGPDAKITASASEDTYSADLLHLSFQVAGG